MNMNFITSSSWLEVPDRPHLDAAAAGHRNLRRDLHGLVQIPGLDQDEPAELFLGLGERAIGGEQLAVPDPDRGRRLHRLERMGSDEMTGSPEGVIVGQALLGASVRLLFGHLAHLFLNKIDQADVLHKPSPSRLYGAVIL